MTQTWLITGGAGFIGSNFLRLAHQKTDAQLLILDALTYAGNLSSIETILDLPRVKFVKGDIGDAELVADLFRQHDIFKVVHFAAESHVDRSILESGQFIKTNIVGTYVLLETARKFWTDWNQRLFLHVSTDEVFGSLTQDEAPFDERSPYKPSSPYAASKASSDHLVRAWHHTYGLPTIVTHCSNNYGPWQFPEKLIPLMILNALEGHNLPVYGEGKNVRDWLHVEDHCEALLGILTRGIIGQIYAIGGGNQMTNLDVVKKIAATVDSVKFFPSGSTAKRIQFVKDRFGHDLRYAINSALAHKELDWKPRHNFDVELSSLVKWFDDHKTWADNIRNGEYLQYYEKQYGCPKSVL